MFRFASYLRRRRRLLAIGTSSLAWSLAFPVAVFAQCAPDPTIANGATVCSGSDTNGIVVTTSGTSLTVQSDASVSNAGASAIVVNIPIDTFYSYRFASLNILGAVSAPGQNAISLWSGANTQSYYYPSQQVSLTIGAGGSVSGTTGLALLATPGNSSGTVIASIDNAGMLTGTGGIALLANATSSNFGYTSPVASFSTIINREGGQIVGGIVATISTLSNAGSINGGSRAAVNSSGLNYSPAITNAATGVIRSSSTDATITTDPMYSFNLNNSGTIANMGSGAALSAGGMFVTNDAGGVIRSSSADATVRTASNYYLQVSNSGTIDNIGNGAAMSGGMLGVTNESGGNIGGAIIASDSVNLVNRGSVAGNVVALGYGGSVIDSSAGTINGSVTLGAGNDILIARYTGSRTLTTGITGAINAGAGNNVERVIFTADSSVNTPLDLATGFQQLVLAPDVDVTATLETGFSTANGLVLSGRGAVVNRTTINVAGQAITDLDYGFNSVASFLNEGSITAAVSGYYGNSQGGVTLRNHSFTNSGQLTVTGGSGVDMSYNDVTNSGAITATDTGVYLFDGVLTNSGSIVSTAAAGVNLFGNVGYKALNSGTITGATTGAITYIYLTNIGTISGGQTGVEVQPYGYLINKAGGVVNGGIYGAVTVNHFNAGVANAGTINGDVNFYGYSIGADSRTYFALPGGTLNGNLNISGGTLVTDLVNTGSGPFAGINGTVTTDSSSILRYAVSADASAVLPTGNAVPFSDVGYQLSNDAKLTLTTSGAPARTKTLLLAGKGSVDLDANIAVIDGAAIRTTNALTYPGMPQPDADAGLSIISRGALAITRTSYGSYYANGAVVLYPNDNFENAGVISVTDNLGYATAGIYGGASVKNSGTITLNGGIGISGATAIVNSGTISQTSGGVAAKGVTLFSGSVENSGTISVGGTAVELTNYNYNPAKLVNSGTLLSMAGPAVTSLGRATISNLAGGTITGTGGIAIRASGTTLRNAGAIIGTVDLGYATSYYSGPPIRSYSSGSYIAAGGTVTGDLLFGDGDDLLMQTGETLGVSGVIDGGLGRDIFGRSFLNSGAVALNLPGVTNFEDVLLQASSADTVVTTTGAFGGNLYAVGPGSLVNEANLTGVLTTALPYQVTSPYGSDALFSDDDLLSSLKNSGSISGGVQASTAAFANSGTVSAPYGSAVSLNSASSLTFANSGAISGGNSTGYWPYYYYAPAASMSAASDMTVSNSGRITGGLSASVDGIMDEAPISLAFTNSGTITNNSNLAPSVSLFAGDYYSQSAGGTISVDNAGTISAQANNVNFGYMTGLGLAVQNAEEPFSYAIRNSGAISAVSTGSPGYLSGLATGIRIELYSNTPLSGTISNSAQGRISAEGSSAYAILSYGAGVDLNNAGLISATGGYERYAIFTSGSADNRIVNSGTINGDIRLDAGSDRVRNIGIINGAVDLGAGDDSFTHRLNATQNGVVNGGDGSDALILDISGGGLIDQALLDTFVNFEGQSITGAGTITTNGPLSIDSLILRDANLTLAAGQTLRTASDTGIIFAEGVNSLTNLGAISGSLSFAGGTNSVINQGSIAGPVSLGTGNSQFMVGAGSSVSGPVTAGGTDDLLILATGGTDQTPQELGLPSFTGFERTRQDSGTLAFSGSYATGQLTLAGGRFIGHTGSILNAPSIQVNQGATFGTAGTVNGNLVVQGTLSPGASPGTMIVNGNLALAGGSTTLFEMTPTVSDALVVNGALSIAPGATLSLTGNRPITPGVTYQLITASNGISGSFTTVNKASTVFGFVRQGSRSIDLLGQFVLGSGAAGQVTKTVDYLNSLLIAGTATSGILNAAPSLLLADGTVNQSLVARFNAESYASASQIGIENGLAIASAMRTASTRASDEQPGLFSFGQMLSGWRSLPGSAATGIAQANISTYGALAGIGFGSQNASVGAFVGYIDARQQIGALQARTKADGLVAGVIAQAALNSFSIAASLSYDGSKADTERTLVSGSKLSSHYRLSSWTADISLGHSFALSDGWTIKPEAGFTHISSRRGGATETGDPIWALNVDGARTRASFLRGAVELHGATEAGISPWLTAGVLHQLSGTQSVASAAYANVPDRLTIAGVKRSETLVTVGAGVNLRVASNINLYLGANSEFGGESSGQSATAGLRIRF